MNPFIEEHKEGAFQVHPHSYLRDCTAIFGSLLKHDDTVNDRTKGSKLLKGEALTKKLWATHFEEPFWRRGCMFRWATLVRRSFFVGVICRLFSFFALFSYFSGVFIDIQKPCFIGTAHSSKREAVSLLSLFSLIDDFVFRFLEESATCRECRQHLEAEVCQPIVTYWSANQSE